MHIDDIDDDDFFDDEEVKSKTQIKKEMLALQELGISIAKMTAEQQAQIPLDSKLREAIDQVAKIKSNSAKKRQHQFIGKLMRAADIEAITEAHDAVIEQSHRAAQQHHQIERWRDELINGDNTTLQGFINKFEHVDRQQLRQLVRAAQKERGTNKPPANTRKLFRFIRETLT